MYWFGFANLMLSLVDLCMIVVFGVDDGNINIIGVGVMVGLVNIIGWCGYVLGFVDFVFIW